MKTELVAFAAATMLLLGFIATGDGQRRPLNRAKPSPQPSPSPQQVTTQSATTDDGRAVILKSDGTWTYDPNPKPKPTPAPVVQQDSTLSFETGLVLRSGDVKPVARGTFNLLDTSLDKILSDSGFSGDLSAFTLNSIQSRIDRLRGATVTSFDREMDAIKPHVVSSTTTDFSGKGQFPAVKPGIYYVMYLGEVGPNSILWNVKVDLKPGQNSVTLDNNNLAH